MRLRKLFKKYFRRPKRYSSYSSRLRRKYKQKIQRKRFQRQLNKCAEKKIVQHHGATYTAQGLLIYNYDSLAADWGLDLMFTTLTTGVGPGQRIGTNVFLRYITLDLSFSNKPECFVIGEFGLYIFYCRTKTTLPTIDSIMAHQAVGNTMGPGYFDPQYLKTHFRKIKPYRFHLGDPDSFKASNLEQPADYPHHIDVAKVTHSNVKSGMFHFRKRFKIMKQTRIVGGSFDIPPIIVAPIKWPAPWATFQAFGDVLAMGYVVTATYTDV